MKKQMIAVIEKIWFGDYSDSGHEQHKPNKIMFLEANLKEELLRSKLSVDNQVALLVRGETVVVEMSLCEKREEYAKVVFQKINGVEVDGKFYPDPDEFMKLLR